MGDRCYMMVTLHGHVKSMPILNKIVEALEAENMQSHFADSILDEISTKLTTGDNPHFFADEVNYGDIETLEAVLQGLGIAYSVDQGAGDGYGARVWSWEPGNGVRACNADHDDQPVLDVRELKKLLDEGGGVNAVREVIEDALKAAGDSMPAFSVSEPVARELAKRAAMKALHPKAA